MCTEMQLAVPLVALPFHSVKVDILWNFSWTEGKMKQSLKYDLSIIMGDLSSYYPKLQLDLTPGPPLSLLGVGMIGTPDDVTPSGGMNISPKFSSIVTNIRDDGKQVSFTYSGIPIVGGDLLQCIQDENQSLSGEKKTQYDPFSKDALPL